MTVAIVLIVVAGVVLGLLGGLALSRRRAAQAAAVPQELTVAELLDKVIQSSRAGVAVLNAWGDVVVHNKAAESLGVVRDNRVDERARSAAERARESGESVPVDLTPQIPVHKGRQPQAVRGDARPLVDEFTVIDAADESDSVRLESARRDFVANVSHELKTPVGALALLAEAMESSAEDPDEVRRFSAKIVREARRLDQLVTELIALSRLQGAESLPEMTTIDVDRIVYDALGRARLAAESAGIEVTTDSDSGLLVAGDRTLLVTALSNLIGNAIAYSPQASPVSVSRRRTGDTVEIAVTDRGIGIAPAHQQRVFERFYRVDTARSRQTGGTGLGLAIVKHVAANHGGRVSLWSRPGTGSTFTLHLPAHTSAPEPAAATTPAARGKPAQGKSPQAKPVQAKPAQPVRSAGEESV